MFDDHGVMGIQFWSVVCTDSVDIFPGVVLPASLARRHKDGVVGCLGVQWSSLFVVVPRLYEQHAGFSPRVWLERVPVQTHHGQNPRLLTNPAPQHIV